MGVDEVEIWQLINEHGINKIVELIRQKQEQDSGWNCYPRFKAKDDITVVYLENTNK